MERPDDLDAGVGLEVLCDQLPDDEPGLRCAAASIATALRGLHHYAPSQNSSADDAWFGECGGAPAQRWPVWGFELPLLGGGRAELCSGEVRAVVHGGGARKLYNGTHRIEIFHRIAASECEFLPPPTYQYC